MLKSKICLLVCSIALCLAFTGIAYSQAPQSFSLEFVDAYLVYEPSSDTLQIAAESNVLSYGSDWEVAKVKPYLYHLRQEVWKDFYWKVNTSLKKVWCVRGGTFGQVGIIPTALIRGVKVVEILLKCQVDVVGGGRLGAVTPTRFLLKFVPKSNAYLIYEPSTGTLQIAAESYALSYGGDWTVTQIQSYLYHLSQDNWASFYWKVDTNAEEAWRVKGGVDKALKLNVDVVP